MKAIKIDVSPERNILIGLITNTEFIGKLKPIYDPHYIESRSIRTFIQWCFEYYDKYQKAPYRNIQIIYEQKKKECFDQKKAKVEQVKKLLEDELEKDGTTEDEKHLIRRKLASMEELYPWDVLFDMYGIILDKFNKFYEEKESPFNTDYLFNMARDFFLDQYSYKKSKRIQELFEEGKREKALALLQELPPTNLLEDVSDFQGYTLKEIGEMDLPKTEYLVEGIIPKGLTMLCSKPKTGKSYLALNIAFAVALGEKALNTAKTTMSSVLYLALEDPIIRLKERGKQIMGSYDLPENITVFPMGTWPKMDEGGTEKLENWLENHPDVSLVIIDTLERVRKRSDSSPYGYGESYRTVSRLQEIASKYNASILAIHHTTKGKAHDIFDTILGSTGDFGACDTGAVLTEEGRGRADAILHIKGKDIGQLQLALDRNEYNWKLMGDAADFRRSPERQRIVDFIKKLNRAVTRAEIVEEFGVESGTDTLLKKMVDDGDIEKLKTGFYGRKGYKLPIEEEISDKMSQIRREKRKKGS